MTRPSRILALAAAGILALTSCADTSTGVTPTITYSPPALPACADVFQPGETIDQEQAAAGCVDPDGGQQMVGAHRCDDGRHLWQVDASTGAKAGWGFGGGKYRASKDAANDPAYSKAYEDCAG
ncbi:hypothetical protein [Micromonospora sp. LOL_024]|uniref:hypothetical protein n=1 Tax=Micromonospora sp. LOL_024 TaxID=3345412 RepID=UPI003A8B1571